MLAEERENSVDPSKKASFFRLEIIINYAQGFKLSFGMFCN